jgi:hypothetical protein
MPCHIYTLTYDSVSQRWNHAGPPNLNANILVTRYTFLNYFDSLSGLQLNLFWFLQDVFVANKVYH